ncbi:Transcriptional regulator containing PAS, AAA-type ATPase, and DNA-binding Fis domains [Caloramator quimbayensis]|uniref:Transcriptional regulator containing PAS, AAA-type ATPase, and DNA-binding Fis domains n=1 Tax=Caloramator quimbayensis TaxID=1147123 RepID=A0A1T4Y7J3_9CLOT|nr:sigma 54-interacting transcriptional regulator [Caloramator quimbayensis]SKA97759.1 Transcriptional regulator containing PAS, AAA-type ATPase, and DNA-binding Fis domains [Caloramator quimbayensis]
MGSILMDVQPSIIKYANIISKVLKVDVEIADSNLIRVAGTGSYSKLVNMSLEKQGYVYKNAIETGSAKIIKEPGKSSICLKCQKRDNCEEKFEVCTPIKLGSKIIGVIGLICFTDEQKNHLLSDFDTYMEFLQQISEFISITAYERKEKMREQTLLKSLNQVIDKMDKGVIILSSSNKVTHINKRAVEMLNFQNINFKDDINLHEIGKGDGRAKEFLLEIDKRSFTVLGDIYTMGLKENQFERMFIFNENKSSNQQNISKKAAKCDDILGNSQIINEIKRNIKRIAPSRSTVLITGESGTGKELFAMAIHNEGDRKDGPFVAINCAAIPNELLESELFGYVKGAFTGALSSGKIGKFELANKGTIFLDEIGDMPLNLQTKLLRVLQDHKIVKIGSNTPIDIDVRVIAATNKDLLKLIEQNKFREDLYYRLNVIPFNIPPLRQRIEDINILVWYFIEKYTKLLEKKFSSIDIDSKVFDIFYGYDWPGNVRELENTIEYMINMMDNDGKITVDILPRSILNKKSKEHDGEEEIHRIEELEKNEIIKALKKYGNTTQGKRIAAQKLGIGIATLYRKIDEYGLSN